MPLYQKFDPQFATPELSRRGLTDSFQGARWGVPAQGGISKVTGSGSLFYTQFMGFWSGSMRKRALLPAPFAPGLLTSCLGAACGSVIGHMIHFSLVSLR
jgi:hypothetical protein